jgi:hypothetical protein
MPRLLVAGPTSVVNQRLGGLPGSISIVPGRITLDFETGLEARELLLKLAMAIANDQDGFDEMAGGKMRAGVA